MEAARVLVLDADGRVGLACVQSLGRRGHVMHAGVRRLGSTTERSRWCARVHQQPPGEPVAAAAQWLIELDARYAFTLVIASTEASLRWLREIPEGHAVRRKAALPSNAALDAALDKAQTTRIARDLGLPVPRERQLAQRDPTAPTGPVGADAEVVIEGYPRVLKPVRSKVVIGQRLASLSVAIVHDEAERAATLASLQPFTPVQEQAWVPGRGVGVEALYEHGRMQWHFVHERLHEWPLTGGASTLRRAGRPDDPLVEMTRRLLDRLEWHGVAMVEWRRAADGSAWFVEVNPRLWGSLPLTIAAGVDMPAGLLALARGEPVPPARGWRVGLVARNLTDDTKWFIDNLRADRGNPLLLTESPWRAALAWLRPLRGGEVWDGWTWDDTAIARAELAGVVSARVRSIVERLERRSMLQAARRRHAELLQDGALSRPAGSVLYLCLGNICRSPFAAAASRQRLHGVAVDSAGFLHHEGRPSPPHVVAAARALGVDLAPARAHRLDRAQVEAADLIVAMDLTHLEQLEREYPDAIGKATLLGLFEPAGPAEMRDPYDLGPLPTRHTLEQMLRAIEALAAWQRRAAGVESGPRLAAH